MSGFWKFWPLSYSRSTDIDRTIIVEHHIRFRLWRFTIDLSYQTREGVERDRWLAAYSALRAKAVAVLGDADTLEWALDDFRSDGSTHENVMDFMQRIVDRAAKTEASS